MKHCAKAFLSVLTILLFASVIPALAQMPDLDPLKGTPSPSAPANKDKFMFIVAGDNRPPSDSAPQGKAVKKIFDDIGKLKPAFVLWSGDIIFGYEPDNPTRIDSEYTEFLSIAKTAGVAVYNAPGNHEMTDSSNHKCPNQKLLKLYLADNGQANPYGAFTYGHSRFIALDTDDDEGPPPAGCDCTTFRHEPPGYIGKTQLRLLKEDLDANTDKTHIFMFMHRPLNGYNTHLCSKSVNELQALFKNYQNVSFVFAGHEHRYYNPTGPNHTGPPPVRTDPSANPPYYLVSGGAGAGPDPGGFFNYLIVNVDGDKVSVEVKPLLRDIQPSRP
jgi:hypothetical protein